MNNLFNFLDKSYDQIKDDAFYKHHFGKAEMESIDDTIFVFNENEGIDLIYDNNMFVVSMHFYRITENGFSYNGELPMNLKFSMLRGDVLSKLGNPSHSGGGQFNIILGNVPKWDKFYCTEGILHVQYSLKNSIELVTISSFSTESAILRDLN